MGQTADEAYIEERVKMTKYIGRLVGGVPFTIPDQHDWGWVGNLQHVNELLREIVYFIEGKDD